MNIDDFRNCVRPEQYFPNSSQYNPEITICESCPTNSTTWSYASWILTWEPGVFGIIGGIANPTGIALIIILTVITFGSLSHVRRSGYFQVFSFNLFFDYLRIYNLRQSFPPTTCFVNSMWHFILSPLSICFSFEFFFITFFSFMFCICYAPPFWFCCALINSSLWHFVWAADP